MEIALFQDITTESALQKLEADGQKYAGLFVDMDNLEERRFVKENAVLITNLLKQIDRKRIDLARDYKNSVESEAAAITVRLKAANEPFTLLIDQHKAKRAEILAQEKAIEEAKQAAAALAQAQLEINYAHMEGLLLDAQFNTDRAIAKAEADRIEAERIEAIKQQAEADAIAAQEQRTQDLIDQAEQAKKDAEAAAIQAEDDRIEQLAQAKRDIAEATRLAEVKAAQVAADNRQRIEDEARAIAEAKAQREANQEHKGSVNRKALVDLMHFAGIEENDAKAVIKSIAKGHISNITINY